ncbi:MAG: hypothetical protein IKH04_12720 [Kiritimatiellae bacterium]|nr:hypothetical protein [Kiritimatiellia bacterium]
MLDGILSNFGEIYSVVILVVLLFSIIANGIAKDVRRRSREKANAQRDEILRWQFSAWKKGVERLGSLPEEPTFLIMKKGECCYYCQTGVALFEVRSARTSTYAGASQGLGHGLRVGGGSGYSTSHDVWREVAVGTLTMTNMRVYFDGDKQDRNVALRDIMSINYSTTTIEISCEKRQRSMVFSVGNGLKASYILQELVSNSKL